MSLNWASVVVKKVSTRKRSKSEKTVLERLVSPPEKAQRVKVSHQAKAIRHLESELLRKEKALADAATLLMLKKKWMLFWRKEREEDRWGIPERDTEADRKGPKGRGPSLRDLGPQDLPESTKTKCQTTVRKNTKRDSYRERSLS